MDRSGLKEIFDIAHEQSSTQGCSRNEYLPLTLVEALWQMNYATHDAHAVELNFFPAGCRHARKKILIRRDDKIQSGYSVVRSYAHATAGQDVVAAIPAFDRLADEPKVPDDETLLHLSLAALRTRKALPL